MGRPLEEVRLKRDTGGFQLFKRGEYSGNISLPVLELVVWLNKSIGRKGLLAELQHIKERQGIGGNGREPLSPSHSPPSRVE
jgi:hypothetical protein